MLIDRLILVQYKTQDVFTSVYPGVTSSRSSQGPSPTLSKVPTGALVTEAVVFVWTHDRSIGVEIDGEMSLLVP